VRACSAAAALLLVVLPARADEANRPPLPLEVAPEPQRKPSSEPLTFGGSADFYFTSNLNNPANGLNDLRTFDIRHQGGPHLGLIDLWAERQRKPIGMRIDLNWGPTARIQNDEEPDPTAFWRHVQQLFVSANVANKGRTYVDFGKWVAPAGAESVEPRDNILYSQGLLFSLGTPYYYLGMRGFHYFNDSDYLMVHVNRGWNAVSAPGHAPGFGITGSKALSERTSFTMSYIGGEEPNGGGQANWRHLFDIIAQRQGGSRWSYLGNATYALQTGVPNGAGRSGAAWYGVAATAKYSFRPNQYGAARLEWFRDDAGFASGQSGDLYSLTLNYTRLVGKHLQMRAEFRQDLAGGNPRFSGSRRGLFHGDQQTFTIATILSY
jgi:hypothetical protein